MAELSEGLMSREVGERKRPTFYFKADGFISKQLFYCP
jgi:hypothetical protein